MLKFISLLSLIIFSFFFTNAQVPNFFSHQSYVRNTNGQAVTSSPVGARISILSGSASGTTVYSERHNLTTDPNGMLNFLIGSGTVLSGNISTIQWDKNSFFIKTEFDITGGANYTLSDVSQLYAVPYALYAGNGNKNGTSVGQMKYWNGTDWMLLPPGNHGDNLVFCDGKPLWGNCIKENVYVLDSSKFTLFYDTTLINAGIFKFQFSGAPPNYKAGDVIIVATNEGFLRKVTGVNVSGNIATYNTQQATYAEVFQNSSFAFNINSSGMTNVSARMTETPGDLPWIINDATIADNKWVKLSIKDASFNFFPNWKFDFKYGNNEVEHFEVSTQAAKLNGTMKFDYEVFAQPISFDTTISKNLLRRRKLLKFWIPTPLPLIRIPVFVVMESALKFDTKFSVTGGTISRAVQYDINRQFDMGIVYDNGAWNNYFKQVNGDTLFLNARSPVNANFELECKIYPEVSFKIMNVFGPFANYKVIGNAKAKVQISPFAFDYSLGIDKEYEIGVRTDKKIIGFDDNLEFVKRKRTDILRFNSPDSVFAVSGNNQNGNLGEYLSQPIKVKVVDSWGNPEKGVPVYFSVISGGGSVDNLKVNTDASGFAFTNWKLGTIGGVEQKVEATVKNGSGAQIASSPVTFTATFADCNLQSFTDPRDGKVYKKVKIGTQEWMAENLNYETGNSWCYNNNSSNCTIYGRIYDWETAKNACPSGWHLPSDAEWTTLTNFLGLESGAGGKMKSTGTQYWLPPNTAATNSSCFSGLPGGYRFVDGTFFLIGSFGYWWSSTEDGTTNAWFRRLRSDFGDVQRVTVPKTNHGFSVRCLRD